MRFLPRGLWLWLMVALGALAVSGWLAPPAKAAFCVCRDPQTFWCSRYGGDQTGEQKITITDPKSLFYGDQQVLNCQSDDKLTDPFFCDNYCLAQGGQQKVFCDATFSESIASVQKSVIAGGCNPTHCWCKSTAGYCSHDTTYDTATFKEGVLFATEASCNDFCGKKNTGPEKTWSVAHFEPTYKNYFAIPEADGGCKFSAPKVNISPYDFTGNIRSEAAELNKLGATIAGPAEFIGRGIRVGLLFIGSVALIMYIYGGLLWMTAAGNTERISKAKQILVYATIGVVAMLGSYLLVNFVFGEVLKLKV